MATGWGTGSASLLGALLLSEELRPQRNSYPTLDTCIHKRTTTACLSPAPAFGCPEAGGLCLNRLPSNDRSSFSDDDGVPRPRGFVLLRQRRSFLAGAALLVGELTAADAAMSLKIAMTVRVHLAPLLINTAPSDSEDSAILQCRCYVVLWHSKVPPRARGSPRGARRWRRRSRAGRGGSSRSSSR